MNKKTAKTNVNTKHKREGVMLEKLQFEHGYTLMEAGRGMEKTQLMFDRRTKKCTVSYVMRLAVPADSALGEMLAKSRAKPEKKGAKKS